MKSKFYSWFVLALALIICLSTSIPAARADSQIAPVTIDGPNKVFLPLISSDQGKAFEAQADAMQALEAKYMNAIHQIEQYITIKEDGTLAAELVSAAALDNVDAATYNDLMQSLEQTNEMLRRGDLSLAELHLHTGEYEEISASAVDGCRGSNKLYKYWWGSRQNIDSCKTDKIVATLALVGVTAGMICIIVGLAVSSPVCAIVAGVIGVGAAYIDWLNKMWGKGIYIEGPWSGQRWVWHQ